MTLKTKGTVSIYKNLFKTYSLIRNVMVGQGITGEQLIIYLRETDYDQ